MKRAGLICLMVLMLLASCTQGGRPSESGSGATTDVPSGGGAAGTEPRGTETGQVPEPELNGSGWCAVGSAGGGKAVILADTGVETTTKAIAQLRKAIELKKLTTGAEVKKEFVQILTRILKVQDTMLLLTTQPSVVLVVGVNGVGKTTTIGKLAAQLKKEGNRVLLSAADTFRAAAADQLTVWAQRAGVDIVKHEEGSDPAAVVFDSIQAAKARGVDVVIIDTAGRLHNKANLMNELNKITRVIRRELPEADIETLMVLDATTGQNGLIQAKQFLDTADLTGIVLTKLDGTAKGGIVFAIANDLQLPVKYVGVGEQIDDLLEFKPAEFVEALLS